MADTKLSRPCVDTVKPLFLRKECAARYLSISESMLDILSKEYDQLKPRKLSAGRCAYLVEDLDAWGRSRPVSDLLPPVGSGYGRAGKRNKRNTEGGFHG